MKSFADFRELEEAKATPCGRCGTTHVPPSQGGTCPALAKEEVELEEAHQVVVKTKQGETLRSAVYPTKEKALSMHYKMAKSGKYKSVETVPVKEEVEQLEEITQGKEYTQAQLQKKIQSGNWEATHDIKPGKHVEMRHHSGKRVMVQVKEESELGDLAHQKTLKHRFLVTYSDPNHTSTSMRKEKQQKHVLVPGSKNGVSVHEGEAKPLVKKYMNKQGYRVHDIEHVGMVSKKVNEEADQLDEKLSLVQGKPPRDSGRFTANNQTRVDTTSTGGRIHAGTVYTGKDKPSPSTAPTTSSKPAKKPSALDAIRAKRNPVSEEADQLDEADRPSMSVGGVRRREDDEGHGSQRYTGKTSTSHFVHINGRHWKTFDNADDANRASAAVQKKYPDKRVHVQTKTFYEEVASEGSTSLKSFAAFAGEAN